MENILFWGAAIGAGAVLGAFLRMSGVLWLLGSLVVVAFVGGFGAAFLELIRPEWLYLLMLVLPLAAVMLGCAAVANAVVARMRIQEPGHKASPSKR